MNRKIMESMIDYTQMTRKLTSSDIASLAGVSQTAVSLVLRGRWEGRVGKETAKRIKRIADENNYRVNRAASLLKGGKNRNISLAVPDSENPFFSHILHSLRQKSITLGYECMLVETENSSTWYDYIESSILGGEISYAINLYNNRIDVNPAIADRMITVNDIYAETPSIIIDFNWALENAVSLLASKGYSDILYIAPEIRKTGVSKRYDTFMNAAEKHGIKGLWLSPEGHMKNNVFELLRKNRERLSARQGIILDDDLYALGTYEALKRDGRKIGEDTGIISMNNTFICDYLDPPLSSFGYDVDELVGHILEMVQDENNSAFKRNAILMTINEGKSY